MSLFSVPRFVQDEFASYSPLFRFIDDYASHVNTRGPANGSYVSRSTFKSFTPKFDVKETKESYELHGELPGITQKDINIEFSDAQTLTIKGRSETHREEGTRPAGLIEGQSQEQAKVTEGEESNGHYHKPTVEDDAQMSGANPDTSKEQQVETQPEQEQEQPQPQPQEPKSKYWVSERSVGEFARTFTFPTRVDQENVKASLKDGVLSIVVPKAQAPTSKRIAIE